jgi:uncharacterized membrane protein YeiH
MTDSFSVWVGLAGTVAFAVTAVLAVAPKGIDLFGATVMGVITAIGGGTIRDIIMNEPVFWATDVTYIWVAIGASVLAFWLQSLFTRREIYSLMLYVDALGVSLFAIQATHMTWAAGFAMPLGPVLMGVVTAIGGGLIRDVLVGRPNLLMQRELYAIPVMFGCALYTVLLELLPDYKVLEAFCCTVFIFGLRAAAIYWDLGVPGWLVTKPKAP